jgi:uncharacterized protein
LFGAFHFDPYKFVPVALLGGLFGYLVVRTGSLFTGIVAHVTNNTLTLLLSVSAQRMASLPTEGVPVTEITALPPATLAQMAVGFISLVGIASLVFVVSLRAIPRVTDEQIHQ